MNKLQGILVALPVPLNRQGEVIEGSLERHINDCIGAGVTGFWVNGATGCCVYLDIFQRKKHLERVIHVVAGRVPVLALVSALSLRDGLELARHANKAGASGVSALPPLLYPAAAAINNATYLKALREAAELPLTYYHVPGLTKVFLDGSQLADLCEQVPLSAIKFSDVDTFKAVEISQRCPEVSILTGMEEVLLAGLALNCYHGTVGATQNFMPGPYVELYNAFQRGDVAEANRITQGICRIVIVQSLFDFTAATYAFLNMLGYEYGSAMQPIPNLDPDQVNRMKNELLKVIKADPIQERRLIESRDFIS